MTLRNCVVIMKGVNLMGKSSVMCSDSLMLAPEQFVEIF